jgi:hypothetical protein
LDDRFYVLQNAFGRETARLAGLSHIEAIDKIEQIVNQGIVILFVFH